jgi:hypothetical protein
LDRHEVYIGVHLALMLAGIGIMLVPIGSGAVASMDPDTQKLLAAGMSGGSGLALLASTMGRPVFRPMRWIRRKIFHLEVMPLHHCYLLGAAGLMAVDTALGVFSWTLIGRGSLIGTATGALTPILFIVFLRLTYRMLVGSIRLNREYDAIRDAVTAQPPEDSDEDD